MCQQGRLQVHENPRQPLRPGLLAGGVGDQVLTDLQFHVHQPAVLDVLTCLQSNVGELAISFDYLTEAVINYATGDEQTSSFVRRFAEMGAPWSFGIDDLEMLAGDAGLIVVDKIKTADLYRTFWPSLPLDSIWYDNYSLCTLTAGKGISL